MRGWRWPVNLGLTIVEVKKRWMGEILYVFVGRPILAIQHCIHTVKSNTMRRLL